MCALAERTSGDRFCCFDVPMHNCFHVGLGNEWSFALGVLGYGFEYSDSPGVVVSESSPPGKYVYGY